jgi:starch synthase
VALLTREYPPEVYGGAGVHVEHLSRELARLVDLEVLCFGAPRRDGAVAYQPWAALESGTPESAALAAMSVDLRMAQGARGVDVVHSHTWYANLGGHLAKLLYRVPHVVTSHSLEPLRPWKVEQLAGGYALSLFCERTALEAADAIVAVSGAMRDDLLRTYPAVDPERVAVIHNGIDPEEYVPVEGHEALDRFGIDGTRPFVMFLGRVTRQKGVDLLLDATPFIDGRAQVVFCAGAADTPELGEEMRKRAVELDASRGGVVWVEEMLPRADVVQLLSAASVFVCPSTYEPFGLINLEAMSCMTPVVATSVGGIPEVVVDGETGFLVPLAVTPAGRPVDAPGVAQDIADRVNALLADPATAARFGRAGRQRVLEHFGWPAIGAKTAALYERVASLGAG